MTWQPLSPSRLHRLPFGIAFGMTDVGQVRTSNEDNFLIDEELGLVMVADGMGGHEAGEVASAGALTAVRQCLQRHVLQQRSAPLHAALASTEGAHDPDATWTNETTPAIGFVYDAIEFANTALHEQNIALGHPDGSGMGTTLTGLWRGGSDGPLIVFQVGDSRLYRLRGGELTQLTRDQTLYQQAIDAGRIDDLPKRNMLLQAVGPSSPIKPDITSFAMEPGDRFLLCSDGLYGAMAHGDMEAVVAHATDLELEAACSRLIAMAKADGGRDNITVVIMTFA